MAKKFTYEELKNLTPEDIEIEVAGPKTPLLAMLLLRIVQTYLLEMIKSEGAGADASQAFDFVSKSIDILEKYDVPEIH